MEMYSNVENGEWALYKIGNSVIKGLAEKTDDGLYWFNTIERLAKNWMDMLVNESDIELLGIELGKEDIDTLINMALMMNDKEWFNELVSKYKIAK